MIVQLVCDCMCFNIDIGELMSGGELGMFAESMCCLFKCYLGELTSHGGYECMTLQRVCSLLC